MATPYNSSSEASFDYDTDWEEHAGPESAGNIDWGLTDQSASLSGWVDYNKMRAAAAYFLGYSWTSTSAFAGYRLYRKPPYPHPILGPGVSAVAVSAAGRGVKSGNAEGEKLQIVSSFDPNIKMTAYEKALLTITFRSTGRMQFLSDDEITDYNDEWKRWTKIQVVPAIETLTVDGASQLTFAEGTAGDPNGVAFPAPLPQFVPKATITVTTLGIPHDYLSQDDLFLYPKHIISLLGCWNTETMFGSFLAGTLLFTSVAFEEMTFPWLNRDLKKGLTGWNMTAIFSHMDPDKGVSGSVYRGHRVFPWRVGTKWYWATRSGGADFLPGADLRKIWKHAYQP